MADTKRYLAAVLLSGVLMALASPAPAEPIQPNQIVVKDGDTIRAHGHTWRLIDFDAPETDRAKCGTERQLGDRAKARLVELVHAGGLDLTEVVCSCSPGTHGTRLCNYGRRCGRLTAKGEDVGAILIREHRARPYVCGAQRCPKRLGWC